MTQSIQRQRGLDALKPYVPGTPIEEVQREFGLTDVIKLASNENPLGPSPKAVAAIEAALRNLNLYPDGQSYYLRHAMAERLGQGITAEMIAMGNGADGIIMQTCMAYLEESDEAIVSVSSFPVYDIYINVMRARLTKIPMKGFRLDLQEMVGAITDQTKMVFVCNPNNPTGTIVTAAEVETFMAGVPDHVLVIFDEAYYELVDSDLYPDTLDYIRQGRKNVMIMRSFSKVYGLAGVRLGYAVAAPEVLAPLNQVKEPFAVNLLAQAAGIAALEDEAFLKKSVETNRAGRQFLYREFERLGLRYLESHTNFVLVEIGSNAVQVQQQLLRAGVIVRPCTGYDLPDYLRVTVGSESENARLIRSLEDLL
jgi:histidinol-phosphate aminotransferase